MDDNTPLCPTCGVNILKDDFFDYCHNKNPYKSIEFWYGFCPVCKKYYTWKAVFNFSGFEDLKLDTP